MGGPETNMDLMSSTEVEAYRLDIRDRVMRMEIVLSQMEQHLAFLNDRTRVLEYWRAWMSGGMALIGLAIVIMIGVL